MTHHPRPSALSRVQDTVTSWLLATTLPICLALSLQPRYVFSRQITAGDFPLVFLTLWLSLHATLQWRTFLRHLSRVEAAWVALLGVLFAQALLCGQLLNGTFLNGYRTLALSLPIYVAGRFLADRRQTLRFALLATYFLMAWVLWELRADFQRAAGTLDSVTHLVHYKAPEIPFYINNLNGYGTLCGVLASLPVIHLLNGFSHWLSLVMLLLPLFGVIISYSRSAYLLYAFVAAFFFFTLFTIKMPTPRFRLYPLVLTLVTTALILCFAYFKLLPLFGQQGINRIHDKFSKLTTELEQNRIGEFTLRAMVNFFLTSSTRELTLGTFSQYQHSSLAHYFTMFGGVGFAGYVYFIFAHLRLPFARSVSRCTSVSSCPQAIRMRLLYQFSFLLFLVMFFIDMCTNGLFYGATQSYFFYFALGLSRPTLPRLTAYARLSHNGARLFQPRVPHPRPILRDNACSSCCSRVLLGTAPDF